MESIVLEVERQLASIREELRHLPPGRLGKKCGYYFHIVGNKSVGIMKNPKLIQQLCRKRFLLSQEKLLAKNLEHLKKCERRLQLETGEKLVQSLPQTFQGVPREYYYHQPAYEQKMNEKMSWYLKHGFKPGETAIYTFEGDMEHPKRLKELAKMLLGEC